MTLALRCSIWCLIWNAISKCFYRYHITQVIGFMNAQCAQFPLPGEYAYETIIMMEYDNMYHKSSLHPTRSPFPSWDMEWQMYINVLSNEISAACVGDLSHDLSISSRVLKPLNYITYIGMLWQLSYHLEVSWCSGSSTLRPRVKGSTPSLAAYLAISEEIFNLTMHFFR